MRTTLAGVVRMRRTPQEAEIRRDLKLGVGGRGHG
jgi:hypothetical protein